jgi:hypothetical protein
LPHSLSHGIFVVVWFNNKLYPYPQRWSKSSLMLRLKEEVKKVQQMFGVTIYPIILDVSNGF